MANSLQNKARYLTVMFEFHPCGIEAPNEAKIWRYRDVGRFLSLLSTKSLYFASIEELRNGENGDRWEGVPHLGSMRAAVKMIGPEFRNAYPAVNEGVVISCWHENTSESVAMWRLYTVGPEGVAIQTTVNKMAAAIAAARGTHEAKRAVYYGRLRYASHESDEPMDHIGLPSTEQLFLKRKSYSHEREIRFVTLLADQGKGKSVPVDLSALIERIVVSPTYSPWAVPALAAIVQSAGIACEVETSDLLKDAPDFSSSPLSPPGPSPSDPA